MPVISSRPAVAETVAEVRRSVADARAGRRPVGLVPTMGALHEGHASLVRAAREWGGLVVVSVFVNPTQFGPNEDFARYPRTLDADLAVCREAGADIVFVPSAAEVYPPGFSTSVEVAGLSDVLEGAIRPGHFRGVATVVLKLFNMVGPDIAFFGEKDYQQQLVLRRMCRDLDSRVEIVTCPTVREPDGLAMSSRNRYLDADARRRAGSISAALFAARDRLRAGDTDLRDVTGEMGRSIEAAGLSVDYALAADPDSLEELTRPQDKTVLLVAARLGNVRLIDNLHVTLSTRSARHVKHPLTAALGRPSGQPPGR